MFRSGAYIAEQFSDLADTDEQPQPAGLDLTVESMHRISGVGEIRQDGKKIADREELEPDDGEYLLSSGAFVVQYGETISIPSDHVGFVLPRSSLLRNGATLETAVWDPGYTGKGEGLLIVGNTGRHSELLIEQGSRIGQIVLAEATPDGEYDGTYQHENL